MFSCSSYNREQRSAYQKLEGWDKVLYDRPGDILDSLKDINTKNFSYKNSAYHTLLITIARNKTGQQQTDDSTLLFAINYFKNKKDYNNLCRALLYKGIILYDLNGYGYVRAKAKDRITMLYAWIFGLTICLFGAIIALWVRYRFNKQNLAESDKRNISLEAELNKARFVNLIHETSAGVLPKLVEDVNKNATRSRKFSSELSDDLSSSVNNLRSLSKNNLSAIAQSEAFLSANPNVKYLTSLSDLETIILILVEHKFCTKEISEQLNTTQARVRAIKAKIRDKILSTEGLPFDPYNTFLILKKEQSNH